MNSVIYEIPVMPADDDKRIYGDGLFGMDKVTLGKRKSHFINISSKAKEVPSLTRLCNTSEELCKSTLFLALANPSPVRL